MISTGMVGTPLHGIVAVQRQQEAREDVAPRRAAMGEDRFARAAHVRRVGIVADHLEREIGLDAGAHVERAGVEERPAAVIALDAPEIDGDQALELEIGLLAAKMPEQHIFRPGSSRRPRVRSTNDRPRADRRATPSTPGDMTLQRLGRWQRPANGPERGSWRGTSQLARFRRDRARPTMIEAAL